MQTGTVKFFLPQAGKRYGFIFGEGGKEYFFHFDQGRQFWAGTTKPIFSGLLQTKDPRKGDAVMFETKAGRKGDMADPWGFSDQYERILEEMRSPRTYRVLSECTMSGSDKIAEVIVLWKGTDVDNSLCIKYPRTADRRMDDLNPTFSCSDFDQRRWFEKLTKDGWVTCEDPRPFNQARMSRERWRK